MEKTNKTYLGKGLDEVSTTIVVNESELKETSIQPTEMEIISVPEKTIPSIEKEIERIEKNIELFNRIKIISLKLTKETDWVFQQGSPYLMDRGAENIAVAFGISISDVSVKMEWMEDEKGKYYTFVASGKAYSKKLDRQVEDIGVCSQRDKFFGMIGGKLKELAEVDMANIRRKAVTNLYNRLIKRLVGLMNITREDLIEAGLDVNKIARIEYQSNIEKAEKQEKELSPDYKKKLSEIEEILKQLSGGNENTFRELLKSASHFTSKRGDDVFAEDIKQLTTERWIDFTLKRLHRLNEERV